MKCTRCNGLDFDVVIPNLLGNAYIECGDCKQGHIVLDKLNLRPTELLGEVKDNTDKCIMFTCGKCNGLRLVEEGRGDLVKSIQVCNRCIADKPDGSVTTKAGDKMTWDEFRSKAQSFE